LKVWAIGNHLVGQAVCDPIDDRHRGVLPPEGGGHMLYSFPPNDFAAIARGYDEFAERCGPIVDVFDAEGGAAG
jgi:hypothetical protein